MSSSSERYDKEKKHRHHHSSEEEAPVVQNVAVVIHAPDEAKTAITMPRNSGERVIVAQKFLVPVAANGEFQLDPVPMDMNNVTIRSITDPDALLSYIGGPAPPANISSLMNSQLAKEIEYQTDTDVKNRPPEFWRRGTLVSVVTDDGPAGFILVTNKDEKDPNAAPRVTLTKEIIASMKLNPSTPSFEQRAVTTASGMLITKKPGQVHELEVQYTTSGLHWEVQYDSTLNSAVSEMRIFGTYLLANNCGCPFREAQLVFQQGYKPDSLIMEECKSSSSKMFSSSFGYPSRKVKTRVPLELARSSKSNLYSLARPVDLPVVSQGPLRVPFLDATVPTHICHLIYPINGGCNICGEEAVYINQQTPDVDRKTFSYASLQIMLLLEFANINNKFGECSLPDGNLRMLHRWRDTALGSEVFHEQYLPHTEPGSLIRMPLKKASHFRAVLKRLDNTLNSRDHIFTETMHLELEDQREEGENIAMTFEQPQPRWKEWTITTCTLDGTAIPYAVLNNSHASFTINTAPKSTHNLVYTVEYTKWLLQEEINAAKAEETPKQEKDKERVSTTDAKKKIGWFS